MKTLNNYLVILIGILLLIGTLTLTFGTASAEEAPESNNCSTYNAIVKYEVGSGYEYGEGLVEITVEGDPEIVTWEAIPPTHISAICVKVGGPGGGSTVYIDSAPQQGSWTNDTGYDVSHIIAYAQPTAVTLVGFTASTPPTFSLWHLALIGLAGIAALSIAFIFRRLNHSVAAADEASGV
jgi:hypothetical protein